MRQLLIVLLGFGSFATLAQTKYTKSVSVMFIGNSYIYYNDLPKMLAEMAASTGDKITWDASTPGGYTFKQHTTDTATLRKLKSKSWDYVVLQEQSQLPSAPIEEVKLKVYPSARFLDSVAHAFNKKSKTIFYMTWGRKNGDKARCETIPGVCTYKGMDSLLTARYTEMARMNKAPLAPVAAVWRYLRENSPSIELYDPDGSHPSEAGSYAAACCFYNVILKKDPALIKYDSKLGSAEAYAIRQATKKIMATFRQP